MLIALWVAATVLVDVVALSVAASADRGSPPLWPHPAVLVLFALSMSQVSLAAIWTGFAGRWFQGRMMGLMLIAVMWSRYVAWIVAPSQIDDYACLYGSLLLAQTIAILVSLTVARLSGARLVRADRVDVAGDGSSGPSRFQFSLREMFSWTTVLAVVLGALRYSVDHHLFPAYLGDWRQWAVLSLANAVPALLAVWATLGTGRPGLRAMALALATAAAIGAGGTLAEVVSLRAYAVLCILQVVWVLGSLCVFRAAGYRVVRAARADLHQRLRSRGGR
ncbi:MAG TPA: hypothetical protein VMY37_34975 [Thermoguttaceae bacterium]|nr:hypothetical protein [Thermoguttaceae bacterium]